MDTEVNVVAEPREEWMSLAYAQCTVTGKPTTAIIDTGVGPSLITKWLLDQLGWDIDEPATRSIVITNGQRSVPLGEVREVPVQFGMEVIPIRMIVSNAEMYGIILEMNWLTKAKAKIDAEAQRMIFVSHGRKFSVPLDIRRGVLPRITQ